VGKAHLSIAGGSRDLYRGLAHVYDTLVGDGALPDLIAAFAAARRRHGIHFRSLADVGCGTGRFLAHLAREPLSLIGIDSSVEMLRIARRRLRHTDVSLLRQDMRALSLPRPVDLITVNFATLNYFVDARDLDRALCAIGAALRPGGALIFDFIPAVESTEPPRRDVQRFRVANTETLWHTLTEPHLNRSTVAITVCPHGCRADAPAATETHTQRWYHPKEMAGAVKKAGLELAWLAPLPPGELTHWWQTVAFRRAPGGACAAGSGR
jgi:SAM-dependent methyltransferase